jgi:hypothetical protein
MGRNFLVIKTGQVYLKCTCTQAKDQRIWWNWRSDKMQHETTVQTGISRTLNMISKHDLGDYLTLNAPNTRFLQIRIIYA